MKQLGNGSLAMPQTDAASNLEGETMNGYYDGGHCWQIDSDPGDRVGHVARLLEGSIIFLPDHGHCVVVRKDVTYALDTFASHMIDATLVN